MRRLSALMAYLALPLANPAHASEQAFHTPDELVSATSSCLSALATGTPKKVFASLESDGWQLEQATTLGGTFRKDKQSVRVEFQNLFGSYVCTVFGNRAPAVDMAVFAREMQDALTLKFAGELAEGSTRTASEFSYVVKDRFTAVVTLAGVRGGFDTKVTTIEKAAK